MWEAMNSDFASLMCISLVKENFSFFLKQWEFWHFWATGRRVAFFPITPYSILDPSGSYSLKSHTKLVMQLGQAASGSMDM